MQFLELSVGIVVRHALLHIRVAHGRIRWTCAAHTGVSIRPFVHRTAFTDFISCSISHVRSSVITVSTSREGGTLVLDDFLKYIVQDLLRVVGVAHLRSHSQDVPALLNVVLYIVVSAFVGQLSHFYFLRSELLVQVEQVQTRRGQFLQSGREHSGLERGHGSLELRRYQSQGLMLHSQGLVKIQSVWN